MTSWPMRRQLQQAGNNAAVDGLSAFYTTALSAAAPSTPVLHRRNALSQQLNGLPWQEKGWGRYRKRMDLHHPTLAKANPANSILLEIWSYEVVPLNVAQRAASLMLAMTAATPLEYLLRMQSAKSKVSIISKKQGTVDIPEYHYLADPMPGVPESGAAYWNTRARGFGGTLANPVTLVAEENIMELAEDRWNQESCIVHELAHAINFLGMTHCQSVALRTRYEWAKKSGAYNPESYIMSDDREYWAMAASAWFGATSREGGVTSNVVTRERLIRKDPGLADMLKTVFGNNPWTYVRNCTKCKRVWQPPMFNAKGACVFPPMTPGVVSKGKWWKPFNTLCKHLPTGPQCADTQQECALWALGPAQMCTASPEFMAQSCSAWCNACACGLGPVAGVDCTPKPPAPPQPPSPPPLAPEQPPPPAQPRPSANTGQRRPPPPAAGGGGGGGAQQCQDSRPDCADLKSWGQCDNTGLMLMFCRKTCNLC